ncbi:MAG: hypothetical protein WCT37_02715 [Patescibacteria group bacterium]|jgi:hypothetical protein
MPSCKNCQSNFTIYPEDRAFYGRIGVPEPTLCPDCRQQRRLAWRNVSHLYLRQCDFSGKDIISNYSPDQPYKVFDPKVWWTDKWDPLAAGRNYDFSQTFFDQFYKLQLAVPRPALLDKNSTNSDYTNHGGYNKNCYMCFNVGQSEDLYYCTNFILESKDCVDCYDMRKCELLYECFDVRNCYNSKYLFYCRDCYDSALLYDCHGCHDCLMCWNLRNAQYCIENKAYSQEEYQNKLKDLYPQTYSAWQQKRQQLLENIQSRAIHKYTRIEKSDHSTGNQIVNCQDVKNSYYATESVGCSYCYDIGEYKDSYDTYESWKGELNYETHAIHQGYNLLSCSICYDDSHLCYCDFCNNSKDCFGCVGLNKKKFCILNKQYSQNEYLELKQKIIKHMQITGEWGEFFPMKLSPFGYNESVAQEYYPLSKDQVLNRGLKWKEEEIKKVDPKLPKCLACGKNFKIIDQEKSFYQKMNLPEPEKCWKCRYDDRTRLRDPRRLYERKCLKCGQIMQSIYSPDRPEKVYCEECYRKEIY